MLRPSRRTPSRPTRARPIPSRRTAAGVRRRLAASVTMVSVLGAAAAAVVADPAAASAPAASASAAPATSASAVTASDRAITGSPLPGATGATLRTVPVSSTAALAAALAGARPGDRIVLAPGTYTGPFVVTTSGTAADPVVVAPARAGTVTLTAPLRYPACDATGPDEDRTLEFQNGASHWSVQGLTIKGGVLASGTEARATNAWMTRQMSTHSWQLRRQMPGAGSNDPVAARTALTWLSQQVGRSVQPADDIRLVGNTVTGKGVFARLSRYGVLQDNVVTSIACGTGPGIWLSNFSNGWTVVGNDVSHVARSTAIHYMQEGIRIGNGSDYTSVRSNTVHDLATDGRAFTTDQDASWNVITQNTARGVTIGFNEQQSGWGNRWTYNTVLGASLAGMSIRMEDVGLSTPSRDTSSWMAQVACNTTGSTPRGLQVGAMAQGSFSRNAFGTVWLGKQVTGYWPRVGDSWNGSATAPSSRPTSTTAGC